VLLICLGASLLLRAAEAKLQCVNVRGQLKCASSTPGSTGSAGIKVTMFDADVGSRDDKMGEDTTDRAGNFNIVNGCASDPFGATIEPYLLIEHKCTGTPKKEKIQLGKECIGHSCRLKPYRLH